jgi:hypothetical protein
MTAPRITHTDRKLFTTLWDTLPVQWTTDSQQQLRRVNQLQVEYQIYLEDSLLNQSPPKIIRDIYTRLEKLNSAERYFTRALNNQYGAWLPSIPEEKELIPEEIGSVDSVDSHVQEIAICVICVLPIMTNDSSASLILTPCNHSVHAICALQWTRFNPDSGCPSCNQNVTSVDVLCRGDGKELDELEEFFSTLN